MTSRCRNAFGSGRLLVVLDGLRAEMQQYRDERILHEVECEESPVGEAPAPPRRPDFHALAKQHGLTAHKTGLISALEARELDIGQSFIDARIPFSEGAFEDRPLYLPEISADVDGNRYLYWKVDEAWERIPEFEERGVRERVLWAWKMEHARHLALREAERHPAMWSQSPPRISEVEGVVYPGDDFMRAVFDLQEGAIGTAMNRPKSAVYVVRVIESRPRTEILFRQFLAEDYFGYFRAGYYDQIASERVWLDQIKSAAGLQWQREPEPGRRP